MLLRPAPAPCRSLLLLGGAAFLLGGCSSAQEVDVEQVASAFADPAGAPDERCDLLAPATLAAFERGESEPCTEAIAQVSRNAGEVRSVEIWGGDAQVKLAGDTLFLTETDAGWRVTAAACRAQAEAPYVCEVTGP